MESPDDDPKGSEGPLDDQIEPLPVPYVDPSALPAAKDEESALFTVDPLEARAFTLRKWQAELKRFEIENERLEKANAREHERETAEMGMRHKLAGFLIFRVCPGWILLLFGVVVANGYLALGIPNEVMIALVAANPIGIGGVLFAVIRYFCPDRGNSKPN